MTIEGLKNSLTEMGASAESSIRNFRPKEVTQKVATAVSGFFKSLFSCAQPEIQKDEDYILIEDDLKMEEVD